MDVLDPTDSMEICTTKCPDEMLETKEQVQEWSKENKSPLCRYDINISDYLDPDIEWGKKGPCPELPVFARFVY